MTRYLEVKLGASLGHEFVDEAYWDRLKEFCKWPPADVEIFDQSIVYTVPASMVAFGDPSLTYEVWSDFGCQNIVCHTTKVLFSRPFDPKNQLREIQLNENAVFRFLDDTKFSDIGIITRKVHCTLILEGVPFTVIFHEIYRCPMQGSDYFHFSAPPRYEVMIRAPITCSESLLQEFCNYILPR